jgi:hypothetical protein
MLYACIQRFDVMGNLEKFCKNFWNSTGPRSGQLRIAPGRAGSLAPRLGGGRARAWQAQQSSAAPGCAGKGGSTETKAAQ